MSKYIQIFSTCSKRSDALAMANSLVNAKLAACVQITPIESIYSWKGKTENTKEWLCIIKSRKTLYKKVELHIRKNHGYELPEITYSEINGYSRYLNWIKDNTR